MWHSLSYSYYIFLFIQPCYIFHIFHISALWCKEQPFAKRPLQREPLRSCCNHWAFFFFLFFGFSFFFLNFVFFSLFTPSLNILGLSPSKSWADAPCLQSQGRRPHVHSQRGTNPKHHMFASLLESRDQVSFLALHAAVQPQSQSWDVSRMFFLLCRHSPCCSSSSRAPHHPSHCRTSDISATSLKKLQQRNWGVEASEPSMGRGSREGKHHFTYKRAYLEQKILGENVMFLRKAIACVNVGFTSPNSIWKQQTQDWFPKSRVQEWHFMD